MKRAIIIIVVITVIAAGFFGYRMYNQNQADKAMLEDLQTADVELGTLTASIGATGKVRSNQSALLTWQTSGTVEGVAVQSGDTVSKDDLLAALTKTSLAQNVILAEADLVSAQQSLDDLLNSNIQQAQALQNVENSQQSLEDLLNPELAQAKALQAIADAEQSVDYYERQVRNLTSTASQADIDAADAQVVIAKDALDKAEENYAPYADKPEDNLTRATLLSKLAAAQQNYDSAVRYYNALTSTGSETDIAVAEANLATMNAQLIEAQREYERIKDGANPADVALLEAQLADAEREYERLKDGADPDDIAVIESRIAAAQATINTSRIKAPFEGTLSMVEVKPGDQVNPGGLAFRIDDFSRLLVDVEVSEIDINQVKIGQQVTLTFDAIIATEYHGEVIEVSIVGDEQQGVVSFLVTVELLEADAGVKPGMTAAVNIVISELEQVLLVPNRSVRVLEGERVVYILTGLNEIKSITVELGASSDLYSEVIGGDLKVGDTIILNPPSSFLEGDFGPPHGDFGGGN